MPEIVAGAAQFCFERKDAVDGLILTGDLVTTGDMIDVMPAARFVKSPATQGFYTDDRQPTISFVGGLSIVPGNHDQYADNFGTPNSKNFQLQFDEYMPNFRNSVGHWVDQKGDALLAFAFADFSLRAREDAEDKLLAPFGQGRAYAHVLQELIDRTYWLRQHHPGAPVIWLIHFAPYECGYSLRLIDFANVDAAAGRLGIAVTLCGHTHSSRKLQQDGRVVYCSGSAGCVDSENDARVHLIHFDVQDLEIVSSRRTYVWSRDEDEFVFFDED